MATRTCVVLLGLLTAIAMTGCGGGGGDSAVSSSCQAQAGPIPVNRFSYPDSTFLTGTTVDISPTIELVPGGSLTNVPLRFELVAGPLPSGLTLDTASGRISGKVSGPPGGFPFTVRLSADCFSGSVTTSAFFTVS